VRELPVELPVAEWPWAVTTLAQAAASFAWKRARLPGVPFVRWFAADGARLGQLDEAKGEIWLSTELADNKTELLRTVGHEVFHATQHRDHALFNEKSATYAGDRFLEVWDEHIADLHAKAAASGVAREPFQRYFAGSAFDAPFDPLADLKLESRRPHAARARYANE